MFHGKLPKVLTLLLILALIAYLLPLLPVGVDVAMYYLLPTSIFVLIIAVGANYVIIEVDPTLIFTSISCSLIYLSMYFSLGVVAGFGISPYSQGLKSVINAIFTITQVLSMELFRTLTIKVLRKRSEVLALLIPSLLFTILYISPIRLVTLGLNFNTLKWVSSVMLPLIAKNSLATFINYLGGPIPAFMYVAIQDTFRKLTPVLPHLEWYELGFVGSIAPLVGFVIVIKLSRIGSSITRYKGKGSSWRKSIVSYLGIGFILFTLFLMPTGILGVRSFVIVSGSMRPFLNKGDIILLGSVGSTELNVGVGDIVGYVDDGKIIIHRIVKIVKEGGNTYYITKGDANRDPDPKPVLPSQVIGKYLLHIPLIGWPAIIARSVLSNNLIIRHTLDKQS